MFESAHWVLAIMLFIISGWSSTDAEQIKIRNPEDENSSAKTNSQIPTISSIRSIKEIDVSQPLNGKWRTENGKTKGEVASKAKQSDAVASKAKQTGFKPLPIFFQVTLIHPLTPERKDLKKTDSRDGFAHLTFQTPLRGTKQTGLLLNIKSFKKINC